MYHERFVNRVCMILTIKQLKEKIRCIKTLVAYCYYTERLRKKKVRLEIYA